MPVVGSWMVPVARSNSTVGTSLGAMVMVVWVRLPRSTVWPLVAPVTLVNSRINSSSSSNTPSATKVISNETEDFEAGRVMELGNTEEVAAVVAMTISAFSAAFAALLGTILMVAMAAELPVLLRVMGIVSPSAPV